MDNSIISDKKYVVGKQILRESDITKEISLGDSGVFKVRIPNPLQQENIEREIALRLGGAPLESFPQQTYNMIRRSVTLDKVIVEAPEWWTITGECYDEGIIEKVWAKYIELRDEFRRSIQQGKFRRSS